MRLGPTFSIDGERLQNKAASLSERAILPFDSWHTRCYARSRILIATFAHHLAKEFFDAIMPQLQQEAEHLHLFVVLSLSPTEDQLYVPRRASISKHSLPEAAGNIYRLECSGRRLFNGRFPLRVNPCSSQLYQGAFGLFAHIFQRAQLVNSQQKVGSVGGFLPAQRFKQGKLGRFGQAVDFSQRRLRRLPLCAFTQFARQVMVLLKYLLRLLLRIL